MGVILSETSLRRTDQGRLKCLRRGVVRDAVKNTCARNVPNRQICGVEAKKSRLLSREAGPAASAGGAVGLNAGLDFALLALGLVALPLFHLLAVLLRLHPGQGICQHGDGFARVPDREVFGMLA